VTWAGRSRSSDRSRFGWLAGIVAVTAPLLGCSVAPTTARDLVTPAAATALAASYFPQRLKAIETDDEVSLVKNEADPAQVMDIQLAKEYAATQAALKHGQASGIAFTYTAVSSIDAYVPHQSTYPATFLADVHFTDGDAVLMGFEHRPSGNWLLVVAVDVGKGLAPNLAKSSDGFAPPTSTSSPYQYDLTQLLVHELQKKCFDTHGCPLYLNAVGNAPSGYRATLFAPGLIDDHISQLTQSAASYVANGFRAVQWDAFTRPAPTFPWYRLKSGGAFGFVSDSEFFEVLTGDQQRCFTVAYQAEFMNALLTPGKYDFVREWSVNLLSLALPKTASEDGLTVVGATGYIDRNETAKASCG